VRRLSAFFVLSALTFLGVKLPAQAPANPNAASDAADKYIWLEDVNSPRSMEWVRAENARTAKVLEADPRFATYQAEALKIAEDPNKLPYPELRGNMVYNFWRDEKNPRGLLRRTTVDDYRNAQPHWQTVLDIDALGKAEGHSWVYEGLSCLYPGDQYCMVDLSEGGEDAVTSREFDLRAARFVEGGFVSPHSKQSVSWVDKDTLLIGRDWGPGTMTKSGYAFVSKQWKRGTPLQSATEVFRGEPSDISAGGSVIQDAQGDKVTLFSRGISFFENRTFVQTPSGLKQVNIPPKADAGALLSGRMLIQLRQDWAPTPGGKTFVQGSLLSVSLADLMHDPEHLKPSLVFVPTADEFLGGFSTTRSHLLITTMKHVLGQAYVLTPNGAASAQDSWSRATLPVPANSTVGVVTGSEANESFYIAAENFVTPDTLFSGDAASGKLTPARSAPGMFDASRDTVEQLYATSKDGTKVPYFVVHRKDIKYDGSNPTLLYAYGGFEVALTPSYSATMGKIWLERGGVYVLANIRGGGEFGPAWHEAGLKTHRQRIYDDFASVAQDLFTRKITSPRRLGIEGGSNGGLLMGVEFTQHPDFWNAVVIQVPLLDMLRFEQIAAGASWVGEYGSVSIPAERAFLAGISPYNQLKPGVKYPEPLIFTTTRDDRVGPQHARKFAAKLEEFHDPFLYDEITEGGHGSGADIKQSARTTAETFVYLSRKLMD
jgi:prolyl oligopeptidase